MLKPLKVLFVEDRRSDVELALYELLKTGYKVSYEIVETETEFLSKLREAWDLIISDDNMPRFSSQRALNCLKQSEQNLPFIIVSGQISEEIAIECMKNGASDYLLKDRLTRLGPAVEQALEKHQLQREFQKRQEERELLLERERLSRAAAEAASQKILFLDEVTRTLNSSLNYKETLLHLADFLVLRLSDWCVIDLNLENEGLVCMASAHKNQGLTDRLQSARNYIMPGLRPEWQHETLSQSGKAEILSGRNIETLVATHSREQLKSLTEIGLPRSIMRVSLNSRGRMLGLLTLVSVNPNKQYQENDLSLVEDLASRAGLYIDNALLYEESQRLHRVKDEFLATLQHELRTPLTSILGWINLLRDKAFDAIDLDEALEIIHRNADAQNAIINDIVDVSRITTGQLSFEPHVVNLKSILLKAVEAVKLSAQAKSIEMDYVLENHDFSVLGDAARLQQVCWNLLSNAIKYTPVNGKVSIHLQQQDDAMELVVADTGMGISKEFLPKVFDRFQQEDSSLTRKHGGLGLGLAIVSHIVEMHGGTVQASSEGKDRGAQFTVRLPLLKGSKAPKESDTSKSLVEDQVKTHKQLANIKVLLIEDDQNLSFLMARFLEKAGAIVEVASSASEGFLSWISNKPNVILCDIAMPDEDGWTLLKRLRSEEKGLGIHTPALAISAYSSPEDRQRSIDAQFDLHMAKPFETDELIETVRNLVESSVKTYSSWQ